MSPAMLAPIMTQQSMFSVLRIISEMSWGPSCRTRIPLISDSARAVGLTAGRDGPSRMSRAVMGHMTGRVGNTTRPAATYVAPASRDSLARASVPQRSLSVPRPHAPTSRICLQMVWMNWCGATNTSRSAPVTASSRLGVALQRQNMPRPTCPLHADKAPTLAPLSHT